MIKIGVTGPTGAGKTTFAKMLTDDLDKCLLIQVDKYMKEQIVLSGSQLEKEFGIMRFNDVNHLSMSKVYASSDIVTNTLKIIKEPVNERICLALSNAEKHYRYCVIDWNYLSVIPIWDELDIKFYVTANQDKRFIRLIKRDGDSAKKNELISKKVHNLQDDIAPDDAIKILNIDTIELLQEMAQQIANDIKVKEKEK